MKKYEAMFIFRPDLGKEGLEKTVAQLKELIVKNKGSLTEIKEIGKQKLAYPIKKLREGVYYLVNLDAPPEAISELKRAFSLNEAIMRAMIVKKG